MFQIEKGIMIGSVHHNDRTCIAHIYTNRHGMIPFIWFLSKSGKNAGRNTLLQPLTQLEFLSEYIPTQSLQHIKEAKNCSPYKNIPHNPLKSAISLFLAEFLSYALKSEQNNPPLFRFLTKSLDWFDAASDERITNFHILFMIGTASHTGICPNADHYIPGYILDLREGCFCATEPHHNEWLEPHLSYKLHLLMTSNLDNMKDAPLTGQERVMLLNALNKYFRLHIPAFPVLKSIDVLDTVFG